MKETAVTSLCVFDCTVKLYLIKTFWKKSWKTAKYLTITKIIRLLKKLFYTKRGI